MESECAKYEYDEKNKADDAVDNTRRPKCSEACMSPLPSSSHWKVWYLSLHPYTDEANGTNAKPMNRHTHRSDVHPKYHSKPVFCPVHHDRRFSRSRRRHHRNKKMYSTVRKPSERSNTQILFNAESTSVDKDFVWPLVALALVDSPPDDDPDEILERLNNSRSIGTVRTYGAAERRMWTGRAGRGSR